MKKEVKTCALAIVLVLMFSMIAQLILPLSIVKAHTDAGDINKDRVFNTSDVAQLRTAILSNTDLGETPKLGDINEDEIVDITDLMLLKRAIVDKVKFGTDRRNLQIGDYIDYTPDTATEYSKDKLAESITGANTNIEDITQDSLKWQILRKYDDGSMDLIGSPTSQDIHLKGALGYNNGVYLMNDICKSLYGKRSAGIEARAVNMDDYEYWLTDAGKNIRNNYSDQYGKYGDEHHFTFTASHRPYLYDLMTDNSDSSYQLFEFTNIYNGGGSTDVLDAKQTYYTIDINAENYGNGYKAIANKDIVGIARHYTRFDYEGYVNFGIFVDNNSSINMGVDSGDFNGEFYCSDSGGDGNISHFCLRPVVKIPADAAIIASKTASTETGTPHTIIDYGNSTEADGGIIEINNYTVANKNLANPTLKLITVYTNDDTKAYTYNGNVMYDITDSGYTHNGETYSKVYGYFSNDSNISASNITSVPASSVTVEKITYPTPYKMDVNRNGTVTAVDAKNIKEVATESSNKTDAIDRFCADIYRKKYVTYADSWIILEFIAGMKDKW